MEDIRGECKIISTEVIRSSKKGTSFSKYNIMIGEDKHITICTDDYAITLGEEQIKEIYTVYKEQNNL